MSHLTDLITKWSHQTVTIAQATTAWDDYGNPVTSASTTITALVQYNTRKVTTAQGEEKVSNCQILLTSASTIGIDDVMTLPDGSMPRILSIEKTVDFDGNTEYIKVYT
jgi:hypothetical protein